MSIADSPDNRPPSGLVPFVAETRDARWQGWTSPPENLSDTTEALPVLLLLHGTGGSRISWRPTLDALIPLMTASPTGAARWRVIAPDLPGHGATCCRHHAQHGLREMAEDVEALLDSLGVGRVALVAGHSAGAAVAIWLAHLTESHELGRVRHVLGIAPSLVPPPTIYNLLLGPALAPLFASRPSTLGITALARRSALIDWLINSTGSQIPARQLSDYRALFSHVDHIQGAMDFMAATDLPALLSRAPTLRARLSLLIADDDRWIPARALRRIVALHYPRAQVEHATGGHLVQESRPRRVADLIMALHPKTHHPADDAQHTRAAHD
jgi:magnesium chelatase accessory protein